ncbi:response regulator receiver protein [Amycolatopsis sp. NPDC051373]|uniref:response regulator receiver protein n=1 Tax=Amycolatopsis sp. NPDC051373 TaxID=3155801 RepID=UPI00344E7E95
MTEGAVIEDRTAALCGFRQCRAPLPPPGPRGGRPFEFCPDRRWPGDRTCKQLAAADQALREALGDSVSHAGLTDAAAQFVRAATELGGPLQTLRNALDSVAARAQDEVTSALTRAETAEARATEADGLRQAAEARAVEGEQATAAAQAHAQEQADLAKAADEMAAAAVKARKAAELDQARAEASATAAAERAERAAGDTRTERARADALAAELAQRSEQLAVRATERDAALTSLAQARAREEEVRRDLTGRLDQANEALTTARAHLGDLERRLDAAHQHQRTESAASAEAVAEARSRSAVLAGRLDAAEEQLTRAAEHHAGLRSRLERVHRLALAAPTENADLRADLLAELLDLPGETPPPGP